MLGDEKKAAYLDAEGNAAMVIDTNQYWFTILSTLIVGVPSAWGAFQYGGKRWLDNHFAKRLESTKHEFQRQLEESRQTHSTELERLKFQRADVLDRSTKLNQREFEVIPEIWVKATEVHHLALSLFARFQQSADVGAMPQPQFEEFIEKSELAQWQKAEIRQKSRFEKTTYYIEADRVIAAEKCHRALIEFNRSYLFGSIFINPDTFDRFKEFGEAVNEAVNLFIQSMQDKESYKGIEDDAVEKYRKEGADRYKALGRYLRERYWINAQGQAV